MEGGSGRSAGKVRGDRGPSSERLQHAGPPSHVSARQGHSHVLEEPARRTSDPPSEPQRAPSRGVLQLGKCRISDKVAVRQHVEFRISALRCKV